MRLPTPRLFSGMKSVLRPAMPKFKVSALWLLVLAWIFLLVWIWWKGPSWSLYDEHWLKPLANRWLATAAWGIVALGWLTVRVMKRLQQLEKQQKLQREEAQDPLSVELNIQQRYLDRWLLRLQRHLDNRRYLWQLPWYMVCRERQNHPVTGRFPIRYHLYTGSGTRCRATRISDATCWQTGGDF